MTAPYSTGFCSARQPVSSHWRCPRDAAGCACTCHTGTMPVDVPDLPVAEPVEAELVEAPAPVEAPTPVEAPAPAVPVDRARVALRLVALRLLLDDVRAVDVATRATLEADVLPGHREVAAITGPDGQPVIVGHVQRTKGGTGSTTARVTDEHALLRWAREHAPHLVTEHVSLPSQRALLEQVKAAGGYLDPATGEVVEVPGVLVEPGQPTAPVLRVVPEPAAADQLRAAVLDGRLPLAELAALPMAGGAA